MKSVHPRHVKPIVKSFTGDRSCINALRGDMSVFNDLLDPTPPVSVNGIQEVPIRHYKVYVVAFTVHIPEYQQFYDHLCVDTLSFTLYTAA